MEVNYDLYKNWFQVQTREVCGIKKYRFCQDINCQNVITQSREVELALKTPWTFVHTDGFSTVIFVLDNEDSRQIQVGDTLEIEPSSWTVATVGHQPNDHVEKDSAGVAHPENHLVKINPDLSNVKNTVSLTRKVVPDETMKVFLKPSMTLTETGTLYLQVETKGLVTGTK